MDGLKYIKVTKNHQRHCEEETQKIMSKKGLFKSIENRGMGTPYYVYEQWTRETE